MQTFRGLYVYLLVTIKSLMTDVKLFSSSIISVFINYKKLLSFYGVESTLLRRYVY